MVDGFRRVRSSSFLGLCFEGVSFLSVSGDWRANAGIGWSVPFNFYNLTNISQAGQVNGCSLIEQMALLLLKRMLFLDLSPFHNSDLLFR
jgi:hypothetical protein